MDCVLIYLFEKSMIQPILDRKVANVTFVLEQHLLRNGQHTDVAIKMVRPPRRRWHRAGY